jgi:hypothetical protein
MRLLVNIAILAALSILVMTAFATAQDKADRRVVVTYEDPDLIAPDFAECHDGEVLTVVNGTGQSINVGFNTETPADVVAADDSVQYTCTNGYDCYSVELVTKSGQTLQAYACAEPYGGEVPTLSEWGLIIFSLLILTLITVVVTRRRTATSMAGEGADITMHGPLFVPRLFMRTLTVTLGAAVIILVVAAVLSTTLPVRDVVGTILSAGIVAYMAHLWFIGRSD